MHVLTILLPDWTVKNVILSIPFNDDKGEEEEKVAVAKNEEDD